MRQRLHHLFRFEHDHIPIPFIADRESVYVERTTARPGGVYEVARLSLASGDLRAEGRPVGPGRVRGRSFVVSVLRPCGAGTAYSLAMEFDLGAGRRTQ